METSVFVFFYSYMQLKVLILKTLTVDLPTLKTEEPFSCTLHMLNTH